MNFIFQPGRWYDGGGEETFTRTFAKYLAKKGHNVFIIADRLESDNYEDEDLYEGKIKIRYIKRIKHQKNLIYFLKTNLFYFLKTRSILRKNHIDSFLSHDKLIIGNWVLKLFYNFKLTLMTGGITNEVLTKELEAQRKLNLFIKKCMFLHQVIAYKLSDKIISISDDEANLIKNKYHCKKKIKVIYHGIDISLFKPIKQKKDEIIIGVFGRFTYINNPKLFLDIVSKVQEKYNVKATWIGPVIEYSEKDVSKMILDSKVQNFKIKGPYYEKELVKEINKIDVFLFTGNLRWIGRSIIEAMSCGLPIVCYNKAELPYGFFSQNKEEIINETSKLIKSEKYRYECGERNRDYVVKNLSQHKQYNKILKYVSK